jgi:hypothetical protein
MSPTCVLIYLELGLLIINNLDNPTLSTTEELDLLFLHLKNLDLTETLIELSKMSSNILTVSKTRRIKTAQVESVLSFIEHIILHKTCTDYITSHLSQLSVTTLA